MSHTTVLLEHTHADDIANFKKELQESFTITVIDTFKNFGDGPVISEEVIDQSINTAGAVTLRILCNGRKIGGAVVIIDEETQYNRLDLFFLKVGEEGKGLGYKAWCAIEKLYPKTIRWQTNTPYFEKRNIHFYVNKCNFKIVEFFNCYHRDPNHPDSNNVPDDDGFLFEKIM